LLNLYTCFHLSPFLHLEHCHFPTLTSHSFTSCLSHPWHFYALDLLTFLVCFLFPPCCLQTLLQHLDPRGPIFRWHPTSFAWMNDYWNNCHLFNCCLQSRWNQLKWQSTYITFMLKK
jgi:hypothetical protein